jgi:hypothetical protein
LQNQRSWEKKLAKFENSDRILQSLDNCQFTITLFDKGLFGLTVLWSCNVMEEAVDSIAESLMRRFPDKKHLFRNEENRPLPYPRQLSNLGFKCDPNYEDKERPSVEDLWHRTRNKVAHHNYVPSHRETLFALRVLISFLKDMPYLLCNLATS